LFPLFAGNHKVAADRPKIRKKSEDLKNFVSEKKVYNKKNENFFMQNFIILVYNFLNFEFENSFSKQFWHFLKKVFHCTNCFKTFCEKIHVYFLKRKNFFQNF
jgi:hypothetical protein